MIPDWAQFLIYLAALFGVFVWLRNDIKSLRAEARDERKQQRDEIQQLRIDMQQLRTDMQRDMQQLRTDMQVDTQQLRDELKGDILRVERKVDGLDSRLRAVESEQSRVVGLLEGLGLAGTLPGKES
jgi:DNA anti-recombination protein RmuC